MRLILRRVALYVVTAIVAITINFFLPRLLPGNPALAVLGKAQSAESPQAVAALEVQYGAQTRTGEWGQYVQYWDHLLHLRGQHLHRAVLPRRDQHLAT